jgi:hypothetical protein
MAPAHRVDVAERIVEKNAGKALLPVLTLAVLDCRLPVGLWPN